MTTTDTDYPKHPLGVGKIVSESFSILFGNLKSVMILGFTPALVGITILVLTMGTAALTGGASFEDDPEAALEMLENFSVPLFILGILLAVMIYYMTLGLLVQMAYDAKLKRPIVINSYWGPALRAAFPIMVLSLVISILIMIGFIALIIPGLVIMAMYSVVVPVVMIEKGGFSAMGRSAKLTKEYRWPILGALIVLGICSNVLSLIGEFLATMVFGAFGDGGLGIVVGVAAVALATAVSYGLAGIGNALIYARLREIKEGVSVDQLASVFD